MSHVVPTLYITLESGTRNERTRAMRGVATAMLAAASDTIRVVEIRPDGAGAFIGIQDATPIRFKRGDTVLVATHGWMVPEFVAGVAAAQHQGARIAALIHDLARLRRPEWYPPDESINFATWLDGMLDLAAHVLVPSLATARDIAAYRRERKRPEIETIRIRLGDGTLASLGNADNPATRIDVPYALVAGPIEIRLNHNVVVEAWRRLAARVKPGQMPKLVFAGSVGPLTHDMRERLARGSDPNIEIILDPDDATLSALYRGCAFTVFPALYEGWGIAVTESLCFGKPVFAANAMALPEAGGRLARYFDPLDPEDTARHIERVLLDPGDSIRWCDEIARVFVPTKWSETARAVLAAMG